MRIKSLLNIFLIFSYPVILFAQTKEVRTYYDLEKKQIKEFYHVNDQDSSILEGLYKTYYLDGTVKTVGFYTKGQATDYWEYFYQNGNLKMEGIINNFMQQGHWIFYFENGSKSMEGNMEKGKKNGYWRFYSEDGKLKSEGMIKEGRNEGEWKYYYDEGIVKASGNYQNGIGNYIEYYPDGSVKMEGKIKLGKSDSIWTYFHPNGKLKARGLETSGNKEGYWQFFYENGNIASEGFYQNGRTAGEWKYYDEEGFLSAKGVEKNGQKEGQWKMFYSNGKIKGDGQFTDGNGPYTEFYENGSVKVRGKFKKGMYDELWQYYYEDGTLEGECNYSNNEGWYIGYYLDGNKKMEGMLKNGVKSGVWKLYKKDGNIAGYYKTYYEDTDNQKAESPMAKVENEKSVEKNKSKQGKPLKPKSYKPKIYLYRPDPNVYKTFILSVDPFQMIVGNLPIYLEYYVQDKFGLEINYSFFKSPFFNSSDDLPLKQIYHSGNAYAVRFKKYFSNDDFIGRPYLGAEYRYKDLLYSAKTADSTQNNAINILSMQENSHELILLLGDRFMKHFDKHGVTLDLYLGIGAGYKDFTKNFVSEGDNDVLFSGIKGNQWYIPFRFGVSLGYAF